MLDKLFFGLFFFLQLEVGPLSRWGRQLGQWQYEWKPKMEINIIHHTTGTHCLSPDHKKSSFARRRVKSDSVVWPEGCAQGMSSPWPSTCQGDVSTMTFNMSNQSSQCKISVCCIAFTKESRILGWTLYFKCDILCTSNIKQIRCVLTALKIVA